MPLWKRCIKHCAGVTLMAIAPLLPNQRAGGADALPALERNAPSKIDWVQLLMFLFALLCFSGAAILWIHSGQTP
jgi:hypothetical protein